MEKVRPDGSGPHRIGSPIQMNEDVYSMLFVSCLNSDYYYYYEHKDKIEEEERRLSLSPEVRPATASKLASPSPVLMKHRSTQEEINQQVKKKIK